MDHPTTGILAGKNSHYYKLYWQYVKTLDDLTRSPRRGITQSLIHQFRVNSLIALYTKNEQGTPMWQLGKINSLKQQYQHNTMLAAKDYLDLTKDIPKETA